MSDSRDEEVLQSAMRWHEATTHGDCDWDGLTAWLEADPAHQQAYADVAMLDDKLVRHRLHLQEQIPEQAPRRRLLRRWQAIAAGALLTVAIAWSLLGHDGFGAREYQATAAAARSIALQDGSRILLAPGSSVRISGWRHNRVALAGVAYFDVPHDPQRTLLVVAGNFTIRDIGTRFEVVSSGGELKVAVAEGTVVVDHPGSAPLQVAAGKRLLVSGQSPVAEYASIAGTDVAGWRSDRLVFLNEPLSIVAQQIGPHAGISVIVDPTIAGRRFSGVLAIGDGTQLVSRLEEIMGLVGRREGAVVHLSASAAAR